MSDKTYKENVTVRKAMRKMQKCYTSALQKLAS